MEKRHKLIKKIVISGNIHALTGICVGGSNQSMSIGGIDKAVVRNQATLEPYIPGSSLKGKMRSLLELRDATIGQEKMGVVDNGPTLDYSHRATRLFGNAVREGKQRPSRIIVRDAIINRKQIIDGFFKNTDLGFTEVKTEVVIDRITSKAMPRQIERIPAGAKFDLNIVLNVFDEDNEQELVQDLFSALRLLQDDYIGGAGSRGSGQIEFSIDAVFVRNADFYKSIVMKNDENVKDSDLIVKPYMQFFTPSVSVA